MRIVDNLEAINALGSEQLITPSKKNSIFQNLNTVLMLELKNQVKI